jgi:hypothetical protein
MLPAPMIPIFNFLFINVSSAWSCDEPFAHNLVQPKRLHKRKSVPRLVREQGQMYAAAPDTGDFRLKTLDFGLPSCHVEAMGSDDFSRLTTSRQQIKRAAYEWAIGQEASTPTSFQAQVPA